MHPLFAVEAYARLQWYVVLELLLVELGAVRHSSANSSKRAAAPAECLIFPSLRACASILNNLPVPNTWALLLQVIEMTSVTSASDIWSVGCLAIELLTGHAPYFDLQPMSALFRIVQDAHPPLPEGVSPNMLVRLISFMSPT